MNEATTPAWVSIGERLPCHNAEVLVWRSSCLRRIVPGHAKITRFLLTRDGPRWASDSDNGLFTPTFLVSRVTHWMPLPAGPVDHAAAPGKQQADQ